MANRFVIFGAWALRLKFQPCSLFLCICFVEDVWWDEPTDEFRAIFTSHR